MTDPIETSKTPGIVIFVAILSFIASFFLFLLAGSCALLLVLGNAASFYNEVTSRINQVYSQYNLSMSMGMNLLFGILLMTGLALAVFYLLIGVGLLRGKKLAWYFQIVLSALGLLGFPFWTALNVIILVSFFRQNIRTFFNV